MRLLARVKNLLRPSAFVPPSQEVLAELHQEITESVDKSFQNDSLMRMYRSAPVRHLLDSAIGFYVGSTSCPRNTTVVKQLVDTAKEIAKTDQQRLDILYYENYLEKLDALGEGSTDKFDDAEQQLLELAEKGHSIAQFMVGIEMYKVARNTLDRKKRKERDEMIQNSIRMMNLAIEGGCYSPFYTLGNMYEDGDAVPKVDYESALNYYRMAASFNHPQAFFKLSQYYQNGTAVQKNSILYLHYLRKAAMLGVVEAQHNLALEYMQGGAVKKDEIKALSWFLHAGACGFPHSKVPPSITKYNAGLILLKGTDCGKLKPNLKGALVKFEEVQKQGDIDATDIISRLVVLLHKSDLERSS